MNSVNLIGNMTKECELRITSTGKPVASFTLAVNTGYGDNQQTSFINCVVWNKQADNLEKYTSKGSKLAVTGALRQRTYENANGQKINVVEVICQSIEYLNTKKNDQNVNQDNFYNVNEQSFDISPDDIEF